LQNLQIIAAAGWIHFIYFPLSYFFGTFLIGSFSIGLIGHYLENNLFNQDQEYSENNPNVIRPIPANTAASNDGAPSWKVTLEKISNHFCFELFITFVIIFDIVCYVLNMSQLESEDPRFTHHHTLVRKLLKITITLFTFLYILNI
jgi:hypothetical protein